MKQFFLVLSVSLSLSLKAQTILLGPGVNNGDFESGTTGWSFANATQNKWYVGTFAPFAGTRGCYIDVNATAGAANSYTNTTAVSHVYRSVSFPAGQTCITLSFKWKCNGDVILNGDNLKVFVTSATPVAGTAITATAQVGATLYNAQTTWQTASITLPATLAGTTRNLVFQWANDNLLVSNPAAAIDDIELTTQVPPVPSCVAGIAPISTNGGCPLGTTLSWQAGTTTCNNAVTYDLYFNAGTTATTQVLSSSTLTAYATGTLTSGAMYAWRVVPRNAIGPATGCPTYTFVTGSDGNNLPCNATSIVLGTIASGDNTCSDASGEPASPSCWNNNAASHTVWYKFTAPASGSVKIRTAAGTLTATQIALYSGACGASLTYVACNDNAPTCAVGLGGTTLATSELSTSGLTAGTTYYIRADGNNNAVGSFAITVVEGTQAYPPVTGQDCGAPVYVCNSLIQVGNPGYRGIGFTCDDSGTNDCTVGEQGSGWYRIRILANGNLNFTIVPNDYTGTLDSETDYDFVLWKTAGTGSVNCASIASSGGANAVACNVNSYGITGLAPGGNAPASYPGYDGAFDPSLAVLGGEEYLLLIENVVNNSAGFSIDFNGTAAGVINYSAASAVVWSGGDASTDWTALQNWGGCGQPVCGVNAIVSPSSSFQPLITAAMGTVTANNVVVDPGATLRLGPGAVLRICGNLTNNGTILADPASTIFFSDDNAHTLNGTLSGNSYLGNLLISDTPGGANCTVQANADLDLYGSLTTANAGSIFHLNGKTLSLAGDLTNAAGANTFQGTTGSTLRFSGSASQLYSPNTNTAVPVLTLNHVQVMHAGPGVTVSTTNTPDLILGTSGVLSLSSGKIITPGAQEVKLMNTANAAVNAGSTLSYVEGNLRRYLAAGATGPFDFPVGHATKGYQRINLDFGTAAAAGAIQLLGRFDAWGGSWPQPGAPGWGECMTTYNVPYLDNGYWSVDASAPGTGSYTTTLYNLNYTNAASGWSVAKSPSGAPAWALQGSCLISPVTAVKRTGMTGFSKFATIQSTTPLPVEIFSFTGQASGRYNVLDWVITQEEEIAGYELQSSADAGDFKGIYTCQATGSGVAKKHYHYNDPDYFYPITYYRLRLIGKQGEERYSQVIAIENASNPGAEAQIFPNPANDQLNVRLRSTGAELTLEISDLLGRKLHAKQLSVSNGLVNEKISVASLATGVYVVSIREGQHTLVLKKIMISHEN